jgi:serine/threonine protein kinase
MCALQGEDDLSDFMIEIDILSECKHPNIVELHEAFFNDGKLWVRYISVSTGNPYIPSVEQKSGS